MILGSKTFTSVGELRNYCERLRSNGGETFRTGSPEYVFLRELFQYWKWSKYHIQAIDTISFFYARQPTLNQSPRMCAVFSPTAQQPGGTEVDFSMKDCVDNFSLKQRTACEPDFSLKHESRKCPIPRFELINGSEVIPPKFSETYEHFYAKKVVCDCITEIAKDYAPKTITTSGGGSIPISRMTAAVKEWPVARRGGQLFVGNWGTLPVEDRRRLQTKRADGVPSVEELMVAGWLSELVFDVAVVDVQLNALVAGIELVSSSEPSRKKEMLLCELAGMGVPTFVIRSEVVLHTCGPALFWDTYVEFWKEIML